MCADEDQRQHEQRGEAWIYRNDEPRFACGASYMYTRALWEQQPFPDAPHEDRRWWLTPLVSNACVGANSVEPMIEPRMVCGIHGGNTESYDRAAMAKATDVWRRAPEFDSYCAGVMQL